MIFSSLVLSAKSASRVRHASNVPDLLCVLLISSSILSGIRVCRHIYENHGFAYSLIFSVMLTILAVVYYFVPISARFLCNFPTWS